MNDQAKKLLEFFYAILLLGLMPIYLQAQLPFQMPVSMVFETISKSNRSKQYPNRPDLLSNITEIKKHFSADSPSSMRLVTRMEASQIQAAYRTGAMFFDGFLVWRRRHSLRVLDFVGTGNASRNETGGMPNEELKTAKLQN
jgi:hypothetical protein